jgi:hypothetical protein
VKTTRKTIAFIGKLAPGMKFGQDHLNPWDPLLGMDIHRHPPAIVHHLQGSVFIQTDLNGLGEARNRLVYTIVDNLLGEMIGPGGIGIHPGSLAYRFKATEDFDIRSVVTSTHVYLSILCKWFSTAGVYTPGRVLASLLGLATPSLGIVAEWPLSLTDISGVG